jgi:hypothetical protein
MSTPNKAKSILDQLLVGRDEVFSAKVLKLVVDNKWDVDDPSFIIALATGQLQVILEDVPKSFEATSNKALQKFTQKLYELQEWSALQKADIDAANKIMVAAGNQVTSTVDACTNLVIEQVKESTKDIRNSRSKIQEESATAINSIKQLQIAQEASIKLIQEEAEEVQEGSLAVLRKQHDLLRKLNSATVMANFVRSIPPLLIAGVIFFSIGLGFFGSNQLYKHNSDQWNIVNENYGRLSYENKKLIDRILFLTGKGK